MASPREFCFACLIFAAAAFAQSTQPAGEKGTFDISFDQRSPLSAIPTQHDRYGLSMSKEQLYETSKERFLMNVPDSYDASPGWGVMVWSNAGRSGGGPKDFIDAAAKKKLLWISADNAGNDRAVGVRIGLALDAVHNLRQRYALDDKRTFVAGISGGGKVAEMAAIAYSDVFDGAIACAGANWYKDIPVPGKANTAWPATFRRPPWPIFLGARDDIAFVFITGDKDPNQQPVHAIVDSGFKPEKFRHVTLWDVPAMGHQAPPVEWFERAIDTLDDAAKQRTKKPLPSTRRTKSATTTRARQEL